MLKIQPSQIILSLILCLTLYSELSIAASNEMIVKKSVRKEMNTISSHIRDMGLYIASEGEFVKNANKTIIQKHLQELGLLFKNIKIHPVIETQGLTIGQAAIAEQLDQTLVLFNKDQKPKARAKLNAALNLCVSCHTQSPGTIHSEQPKFFQDKDISKLKISDFERAELYFITRDFESAIKLYDKFLNASKKSDDDEFILKALERQLIYYLKIKRSFPLALDHFTGYLKDKRFNDIVNQEISDWVKALSGKSLWDHFDAAKTKEEEMDKFMKNFITDDEEGPIFTVTNSTEVFDLNLSSILMDYYNAHPDTKLGAKILYWMAIIDKRVNDDLFFSLGDYYLLACMEKYNKDPVAKECYEAYMDELEINYLTTEKEFPSEIKAKILKLQQLLNLTEAKKK